MSGAPPFDRWGRVAAPAEGAGAYLLVEHESAEGWKQAPPADAIRVWQRMPGEPDDSDFNWSVWLHESELAGWMAQKGYEIPEWLPQGVEPDWQVP